MALRHVGRSFQTCRRIIFLTCLVMLASLSLSKGQESEIMFRFPAFSMILQVQREDKSSIVFQERLEIAIRKHLKGYFTNKLHSKEFDFGMVRDVDLSSQLFWREIEEDSKTVDPSDGVVEHRYQVRASFQCQIGIRMNAETAASQLTSSIMDLLLIEAFQGDNYWRLFHLFLSDEELDRIDEVEISVMVNGFHSGTTDDSDIASSETTSSRWTTTMIIGVGVASFLFCIVAVLWTYLCLFVRGTCLFRVPVGHLDKIADESVTDHNSSDDDIDIFDPESHDEESSWMDAWATSITSIPLREPVKTRRKKNRLQPRRPSQQHSTHLSRILELDVDDNGVTVAGAEERKSIEVNSETCTTLVLYNPASQELVEYQPRSLALYGSRVAL